MADNDRRSPREIALRKLSVDDLTAAYKNQDLFANDYNKALRDKARYSLEDLVTEQGWGALWPVWMEHLNKGWENIKEGASKGVATESVRSNIYNELLIMYGQIQVVMAPLSALGEVTGVKAEKAALRHGASPGLAWWIGRAADIGSGFAVPSNLAARSFAKGVQAMRGGGIAAKAAVEGAEAVGGNAAKLVEETKAVVAATEGLVKDGVVNAETIVAKAAEAAGNPTFKEGIKKATQVVEKIEELAKEASTLPKASGEAFELSKALVGAKPRYNFGDKPFELEFANPLDKALYILAQKTPSKQDARYLKEVQEWFAANGMPLTTAEIRTLGQQVRARIKEMAKGAEPGTLAVPAVTDVANVAKRTVEIASFVDDATRLAKSITAEEARTLLPPLMKQFGISWPDLKRMKALWGGDRSLTPEQFYGYLKALEPRVAELSRLAKQALAEGATPAQQNEFARYATQLFTGNTENIKYTSEFMKLLTHWNPEAVAKGDIAGAMRTFASDLARMTPDNLTRLTLRNQDGFVKFGELGKVGFELSRNILLPLATPAAIISNSWATANTIFERAAAGNFREAWWATKGMALAMADATRAAKMAYQTSSSHTQIQGAFGHIVNIPTDNMIAIDAFYKVLAFRGHLYAEGFREAQMVGARNVGSFVRNFVRNPSIASTETGWEIAQRATYQNTMGWFGQRFTELVRGGEGGPGTLFFMFVKSPVNLAKYSWNHTPVLQMFSKQLYNDIAAGGAMADMAIGRMTMATLQGMMLFEMARDGQITGHGPTDPALRRAWLATHESYSVKTPQGWVPYQGLAPLAYTIGTIADYAEITDRLSPAQAEQIAMAVTFSLMNNFADATAWRQLSDIVDVANGVQRGERLTKRDKVTLMQPAMSILSGGPIASRTARVTIDPVARDARTVVDDFKRRIPGYSLEVPPLRDGYGDVVIPPETPGSPWFGYLYPLVPKIKPLETDPVKLEGAKLQVKAPMFPDFITRSAPQDDEFDMSKALPGDPFPVGLTPPQRDRWQQIYRNVIKGTTDERFTEKNPGIQKGLLDKQFYKDAPLGLQRKLFESFLHQAKQGAKESLLLEDEKLYKAYLTAEAKNAMQFSQPEARPAIEQRAVELGDMFHQMTDEQRDNLLKWGILEPDQPVVRDDRVLYSPARQFKKTDVAPGGRFYEDKEPLKLEIGGEDKPKTGVDLKVLQ